MVFWASEPRSLRSTFLSPRKELGSLLPSSNAQAREALAASFLSFGRLSLQALAQGAGT